MKTHSNLKSRRMIETCTETRTQIHMNHHHEVLNPVQLRLSEPVVVRRSADKHRVWFGLFVSLYGGLRLSKPNIVFKIKAAINLFIRCDISLYFCLDLITFVLNIFFIYFYNTFYLIIFKCITYLFPSHFAKEYKI